MFENSGERQQIKQSGLPQLSHVAGHIEDYL